MNGRQRLWLALAALSLLAALLALLLQLEPVRQRVELGPGPQVRANPWLAAERFLAGRAPPPLQAGSLDAALSHPAAGHSLLLLGTRQNLGTDAQRRLLEWSASGGHLILAAEDGPDDDALLAALGVRLRRAAAPPQPGSAGLARLPLATASARLAFDPALRLHAPGLRGTLEARSAAGLHLLQRDWGHGRVTLLSDARIWHNARIGEHDHAWLLGWLTRDSRVILLTRNAPESLWQRLRQHYPEALLALALALGLLLWHHALRLGPQLPDAPAPRRSLGEHLLAASAFLVHQQGRGALLEHLRRELLAHALQRHPELAALDAAQRLQQLARISGETPERIAATLAPPSRPRPGAAEFTRQVARLQALRNRL